jgi:hypothetical protein
MSDERVTVIADPEVQVMWLVAQIERTINETGDYLVALSLILGDNPQVRSLAERLLIECGFIEPLPNSHPTARSGRVRSMPRRRRR